VEFGKLASVDKVQWNTPQQDPLTKKFLDEQKTLASTKFYLGAPAWGRKEWVGRLYPEKTPASDFLFHYARNFNCIELNTTHYRIPTFEMVKNWIAKVPEGFLFCPKFPQLISHDSGGLQDQKTLDLWIQTLAEFDAHLGPCWIQLPPHFSYKDKAELFYFLQKWPADLQLALEFRHPTWFKDGVILPALVEYLQRRKIGLVITDVAGRRDVLHGSISAPFTILRFIGNDLHPSDYTRMQSWAVQIREWQSYGLAKIFFMVHEPDDIKTPEMADFAVNELNQVCNARLLPLAKPLVLF
jgi:uncharacterized protein YecE (DUF72 family)